MRAARGGPSHVSTKDKPEKEVEGTVSDKASVGGKGKGSVPVRDARVCVEFIRSRLYPLLDTGE